MEIPNEQDLPQPPYEPSSETICMVRTFSQNQNFNYRTPQIGLHRHILYRLNPIKKYSAYQGKTWKCDVCGKVAKPKDESWNCPKCNFDACDECVRNRHSILFPQAICDKLKEKSYVDFDEKTYDGFAFTFGGKEKVIYDSSRDEKLRMILLSLDSGNLYQQYKTLETQKDQYLFLSKFVYDLLGKNNSVKQCDEDLAKILKLNNSRALYIGQMTYGVCRHKAALFKFLCDRMQLPCRILVGTCNVGDKVDFHSWNVVKIGDVQYLLDVYNAPKKMFDISDEEIVKRYKRISWMQLREAMNKSKSGDKPKGEPDYVIGGPGGYSIGPK